MVAPSLADNLMRLVAEGAGEGYDEADAELRSRAAASYLSLLSKPKLPDILLKVLPLSHCTTPVSAALVPAKHTTAQLMDSTVFSRMRACLLTCVCPESQ